MNNEKLENLLNLALNATPEEREKSLELNVGYDTASRSWEVIVKASGGFDMLPELQMREVSQILTGKKLRKWQDLWWQSQLLQEPVRKRQNSLSSRIL